MIEYKTDKKYNAEINLKTWKPIQKLLQNKIFFSPEFVKTFQFYQINVHLKDFFRGRILKIETGLEKVKSSSSPSSSYKIIFKKNGTPTTFKKKFWAKLKGFFLKFRKNEKNVFGLFIEPGIKNGFSFNFFEILNKKNNFLRIKIKQKPHRFFFRSVEDIYINNFVFGNIFPLGIKISIKHLNGKVLKILFPDKHFGIKKILKNFGMPCFREKKYGNFWIKIKLAPTMYPKKHKNYFK